MSERLLQNIVYLTRHEKPEPMDSIRLVATDLDGTLLHDDKHISETDRHTLKHLGQQRIVRVAATGRSMHKVNEVIGNETEFDYVVFSSGGGIFDWKKKSILTSEEFGVDLVQALSSLLLTFDLNFFVFSPIPHNNRFLFHQGGGNCPEFTAYLERHRGDGQALGDGIIPKHSGHFMAIIPQNVILFETLKAEITACFPRVKVIRTTSPVNGGYIWLELFPETVSKGHGLKWLGEQLNILPGEMAAVGNDFNDLDMLDYVAFPFVLANAPSDLKANYPHVMHSNRENGFTEALARLGIL